MNDLTIDKYGAIGQVQPGGWIEGGDSVNWEGHRQYLDEPQYYLCEYKNLYFRTDYKTFFRGTSWGYVRHPFSDANRPTPGGTASVYKNPYKANISRDQLTGILAYYIKYQDLKEAFKIILHHGCWGWLFSYNTIKNGDESLKFKWPDPTLLDIWAMELRAITPRQPGIIKSPLRIVSYLILMVLDIQMLFSTLLFNREKEKYDTNGRQVNDDIISFGIKSIAQKECFPTIISSLSWRLLKKEKLLKWLKSYWCGWRKNCGMYELYEKKIKELLK